MSELFITFLASFLIWFLFAGVLVLWIVDGKIKKEIVLHALFAVFVAWLLTIFVKEFFPKSRPYMNYNNDPMTVTTPIDGSFPSSHTAVAFALSTTIFLHDKRTGLWFFLGALLVALGRILAAVHYPSDIMFGAIIGFLVAWFVEKTHMFGLLGKNK